MKPAGDPVTGRLPLLVQRRRDHLAAAGPTQPQAELYRNAAADEVLFVHKGRGTLLHDVRRRCRSGRSITSSSRTAPPTGSISSRRSSRICW